MTVVVLCVPLSAVAQTCDSDEDCPDDGDPCTLSVCFSDVCGTPPVQCDDGDPSTVDYCDPAAADDGDPLPPLSPLDPHGACVFESYDCTDPGVNSPCDDGDPCTIDVCNAVTGACEFFQDSCDDGNPCTIDACFTGLGCGVVAVDPNAVCSDDDPCTSNDHCDAVGDCDSDPPVDCDDDNLCTFDFCDEAEPNGCVNFDASQFACDDDNACTLDQCDAVLLCFSTSVDCDDGEVCTSEWCDAALGCLYVSNTESCDDGNECTADDACSDFKCEGEGLDCDDGNPCTDDSCTLADGCSYVNSVGPCSDGDACSVGEACLNGACVGGQPDDCDDGNACSDDNCDPVIGCTYTDSPATCEDGDACTMYDFCLNLACVGGPEVLCGDGVNCTNDSCDSQLGCVFDPVICDDDDACTIEVCDELIGMCNFGPNPTMVDCDDDNACTDDACDPETGCYYEDISDTCDDGDSCTEDGCDAQSGCTSVPIDCDDGDACTNDVCDPQSGQCESDVFTCDDMNQCTDDWCDPLTGCQSDQENVCIADEGVSCTVPGCEDGECESLVCSDPAFAYCCDENGVWDDACADEAFGIAVTEINAKYTECWLAKQVEILALRPVSSYYSTSHWIAASTYILREICGAAVINSLGTCTDENCGDGQCSQIDSIWATHPHDVLCFDDCPSEPVACNPKACGNCGNNVPCGGLPDCSLIPCEPCFVAKDCDDGDPLTYDFCNRHDTWGCYHWDSLGEPSYDFTFAPYP